MDEQARISVARAAMGRLEKVLCEAKRLNNLRLHQIAQSLLWIGGGPPVPEVVKRLNITARTAYNWIWEFAIRGFSWLGALHYHGRGRKARLSAAQKNALRQMATRTDAIHKLPSMRMVKRPGRLRPLLEIFGSMKNFVKRLAEAFRHCPPTWRDIAELGEFQIRRLYST